jgi:hypothetical protein
MKKILLILLLSINSLAFAQNYILTVSPKFGCPNTSHNVNVSVKNNSGTSLPSGITYVVNLQIEGNVTVLKTFTNSYSDGFPNQQSKTFTFLDVPFTDEMTCKITGTVSVPAFSVTNNMVPVDYIVQYPYDLAIVQNNTTLNVTTALDGYEVQYFKNSSFIAGSADGAYSPTSDGSYTAKAISSVTSASLGNISCSSENYSNAITYYTIQLSASPLPGCPKVAHDVIVSVTNNGPTLPSTTYTINLNVHKADNSSLKSFNQTYSDGFATGTTKEFRITDVPFEEAMTCKILGSISGMYMMAGPMGPMMFPFSYTIPTQNYLLQSPPDLTITQTAGELNVSVVPDGYKVQYFMNGNPDVLVNDGIYSPTVDGSYTAKGVRSVYSTLADGNVNCYSENPSNAITIGITAIEEAQSVSISVYPNPIISTVTIAAGTSSELRYELSDINGKIIRSASFNETGNINVENLTAGSYILIIKNQQEKIASYKLVK